MLVACLWVLEEGEDLQEAVVRWDCLCHLRPLSVAPLPPLELFSGGGGGGGGSVDLPYRLLFSRTSNSYRAQVPFGGGLHV